MSGKDLRKSLVYNDVNEALYDVVQSNVLPDSFQTEPRWPEWNDAEVNSELWGNGAKPQMTTKSSGKSESNLDVVFTDPEPGDLPPELEKMIATWKRPHNVFPQGELTVFAGKNVSMVTACEAASNCELYRTLSDVIQQLCVHSREELWPPEWESTLYTSNTKGQSWKPWHHIYGNSKAGKEYPHRPTYHKYGKYFVRLFYLNSWRKFIVDDLIPCDPNGECLLPVTLTSGELWPILLTKAILKITSLTPSSKPSVMDLPMWSLFTGWVHFPLYLSQRSKEGAWRRIYTFSPQFEGLGNSEFSEEDTRPAVVIALLSIFPQNRKKVEETIFPVTILMTRCVSSSDSETSKPTEPWKRIRWVEWAAKKGLWTERPQGPPQRWLQVVNFNQEVTDLVGIDQDPESQILTQDEDFMFPEAKSDDNSLQWFDYEKMSNYLIGLYFLSKPSAFEAKYRLTCLTSRVFSSAATSLKLKTPAPSIDFETIYFLPIVNSFDNEPPIMFCECAHGIVIQLNLWVSPQGPIDSDAYLAFDQPDFLKVYHGCLIIETYDWRTSFQNEILNGTKTVGYGSFSLFLNPGRHAFKLWLDVDCPFVVHAYSNTELTIGRGPKIRFLMSTESLPITSYIQKISSSFIDLCQKYGKPDHWKSVSAFYQSIKPKNTALIGFNEKMNNFFETFSLTILMVLKSLVTNDEDLRWMMKALQSLFVNPSIQTSIPKLRSGESTISQKKVKKDVLVERREGTSRELLDHVWSPEEVSKAVTVQRFFRGFQIRQLIRYQSPGSKEHKIITEKLKKICDIMFAPGRREVEIARLIRDVIATSPDLLMTFTFYRDIFNVTVTEEFTGKIVGVEPNSWVPMIRFTFACHSQDPLPCAFYHSCNLEQYQVTVMDNDTGEEIFRLVNATCPHYYPRNEKGYTLFVYGWNESSETKTVNWRLEMIKMKYFLEIHPCNTTLSFTQCHPYHPQPLTVCELRNFYVPNKKNMICTCQIKVRMKVLLTVRLSLSYEDARFFVRIYQKSKLPYSEESDAVVEIEAKNSAIILPSLLLNHDPTVSTVSATDSDEQTLYVLEAYVVDNSWPLTKHEWGVVEPMRVNGESWQESLTSVTQSRKSQTGSRRKSLRKSSQKTIESPFWYLQVVSDLSAEGAFEVTEDRSYQNTVRGMKISWEESDPGRHQRGKMTRKQFLRGIFDEMKRFSTESASTFSNVPELFSTANSFLSTLESLEALLHDRTSFSYLLQDKSTRRHWKSPRILPWTPLGDLVAKYGQGSTAEFSFKISETLFGEDYFLPYQSKTSEVVAEDERQQLLVAMKDRRTVMDDYWVRERKLSRKLMQQAYEQRSKIINRMRSFREKIEKGLEVIEEKKSI